MWAGDSELLNDTPMSKVAVVVSRRFIHDNGRWYTIGAAGPETGERYLQYFDEVIVCGRRGKSGNGSTSALTPLDSRISVVFLPCLASPFARIAKSWECKRVLKKIFSKVDAVIIRHGQTAQIASALASKMKIPLAFDVGGRTFDNLISYGSIIATLYAPFAEWRARSAIKRADYVSYVTQKYLQECYPARDNAVVFAGSNVAIPEPSEEVLQARLARIHANSQPLIFGTIGSLSGRLKGIHLALEAFARCSGDLPAWEYRVLGGGDPTPLKNQTSRLGIGDRVFFDGSVASGEPVLQWLDGVDVYLHPSLREGVPRVVIEAMSRACPVIATSVAGTPELLEQDDLIPAGDVAAICSAINKGFAKDWRLQRAQRNWCHSKLYTQQTLGARRDAFWLRFAFFVSTKRDKDYA
jgi:glycosyltransferase involved in cell wall biosynthesis